jgi:FAD/FMN-containing dehydrogenase
MDVVAQLINAIGEKNVVTGAQVTEHFNGILDPTPMRARAIVFPRSTEDVSAVMKICHDCSQPVVIQGGKSGAVQGHVSNPEEIAMGLGRMSSIEEIDTVGRTATVQAGCILETLQDAATDKGLMFPVDLGGRGSCTIGGNIATNAGGERVIRYGMMREQVLGLEVVLADGTVLSSMNSMIKNNTGYDLKQLFIGSEGTLGVVTRAVVRLQQGLTSSNVALVAMESFDQVLTGLHQADAGLAGQLTAYELMSKNWYELNSRHLGVSPMEIGGNYYVVVETQGSEPEHDLEKLEKVLMALIEQGIIDDAVLAKSQKEVGQIWDIRESVEAATSMNSPYFIYDVSVPMKHMEAYLGKVETGLHESFPEGQCYCVGHVGDGNLHFVVLPFANGEKAELHRQVNDRVYQPLAEFGGSISAEHGVGIEKKPYLVISRNETELQLMKTLKTTLDPKNILGRGRIFDH